MMNDKVKRLELSDELVNKYDILDVFYDSYNIEINFTRLDRNADTVTIPVLQYAHDTINQLDSSINGSMSLDAFTHLKHYLSLKFPPIWHQIYKSPSATTGSDNRVSEESTDELEILSVSEALRRHSGRLGVRGTITSLSKLFKMISGFKGHCDNCDEFTEIVLPEPVSSIKSEDSKCPNPNCQKLIKNVDYNYCNAVNVELQDLEQFNDLERLPVLLFDKDTENVRVGENIIVKGQIWVRKLFPCFYAKSIQYDKNDKITLTELDIDAINRFTNRHGSKIIDELASMFDHSIIAYEHVKTGLLLSAVNSNADNNNNNFNKRRERIHSLLIGGTGLAKSRLLRSVTRLIRNSRYESGGRNSSGKSLTAIVAKEEENYVLRLGPIPLSKNALCAVNEFGRTDYEDQAHFLDVMEEGEFTINKHGINARIKATTTIIASANPINNSTWLEDETIDLNEIPALKPIIDRFDLIFVFRPRKNEDEIREYAYRKSGFESNKIPDYSHYVIRHLEYAKRFNPVISDEATNAKRIFHKNNVARQL
jgi:replicative DNA helicase Mcm